MYLGQCLSNDEEMSEKNASKLALTQNVMQDWPGKCFIGGVMMLMSRQTSPSSFISWLQAMTVMKKNSQTNLRSTWILHPA